MPSGLTEKQFNEVIDKVENTYSPIVTALGANLVINRDWIHEKVNAATTRTFDGKTWIINLYGGLARHPETTEDSFALVICHELGHHLGGAPKKTKGTPAEVYWPSTEGEADYFAALKCFRKVFDREYNSKLISDKNISSIIRDKCLSQFKSRAGRGLCIRTTLAAEASARVSATIRLTEMPSLEIKDPAVVEVIYEKHPLPQCRLDTFFNAALCPRSYRVDLSDENYKDGACYREDEHKLGDRPYCWFRP